MDRIEEEQDIDVYIDGSCINNGKMNAKAGYGVFFTHDDVRNESNVVEGKQTNNTGELTAMIRALEILKKEIEDKRIINIYTDSEYVMKCSGSYGEKLAKNNWKTKEDKIPPNLKLLQKIYDLYHDISEENIKSIKDIENLSLSTEKEKPVRSNTGDSGVGTGVFGESEKSNRVYIKVSFKNKDAVKKHGCKWDPEKKSWYYFADTDKNKIEEIMMLI